MKLRKVLSSVVAGSLAVSAMAISSSAALKVVPQDGHFKSGTGSWMPVLYSDGTFDASEKDPTDYGIDCTQIGSIEVTITPDDTSWFEGAFGGAIVLSSKSEGNESHNWNGKEYWGTVDEEAETPINTVAADKPVVFVKTGDYTYTGTMIVDDSNCVFENPHLVQIAVQEWGQDMSDIVVKSMVVKDKDGNEMISFDENGKASLPLLDASAAADDDAAETEAPEETTAAPEETEAPADDDADADEDDADADADADEDDADADEDDADADEDDADADDEVPAETTAAPAETTAAPATSQAPAAGNVDAATDSSKGSPDTGVADVAAVAGLAIVAGGAVLVAKKRK